MDKENKQRTTSMIKNIIIVILLLVIAWLVWTIQGKDEVITVVSTEKTTLENEYTSLLSEYEALQTDNDTLSVQLLAEQKKIKEILEELASEKEINSQKIASYKNELKTLRKIMKGYIFQIDSLNTLNQKLIAENQEISTNFEQTQAEITELSVAKGELEDKVSLGSVVHAQDITVMLLNESDKLINADGDIIKAKKVNKVRVDFILRENALAKSGLRFAYIRISKPDGLLLTSSGADVFIYQEQEIVYSAKREVNYQNEDIEMSVFWTRNQELPAGTYTVDIFFDGHMIGSQYFELK